MFCNQCGSQNPEDAFFCHQCGNRVYTSRNTEATTDAPTYMPIEMQSQLPFTPPPTPTVLADEALWTVTPQSTPLPPYPYFPPEAYNTPPPPPLESLMQTPPPPPPRQYPSRRGIVVGLAGLAALVAS